MQTNVKIYRIYEKEQIGSVEVIEGEHIFIENIFLAKEHRNKGYLRKIIDFFKGKPIVCLPLPQHIPKFTHLGFVPYKTEQTDNYYILK